MTHIFISYSKQNIEFTRYLRALLENAGFPVWLEEAQLTPNTRYQSIKGLEHMLDDLHEQGHL